MIEIEWMGGACPVQAEGTFDGVPFYFRARGTSVTVDVQAHGEEDEWYWTGPEYEWPDAGYLSDNTAHAFIHDAYTAWLDRNNPRRKSDYEYRRMNGLRGQALQHLAYAADLERSLGDEAKPCVDYLMAEADRLLKLGRKE